MGRIVGILLSPPMNLQHRPDAPHVAWDEAIEYLIRSIPRLHITEFGQERM